METTQKSCAPPQTRLESAFGSHQWHARRLTPGYLHRTAPPSINRF